MLSTTVRFHIIFFCIEVVSPVILTMLFHCVALSANGNRDCGKLQPLILKTESIHCLC